MADQKDLLAALVEFSDTLVRDHDVVEFLQRLTTRCVDLVDTSEAGIMLADRDCTLQHVVASNDRTSLLALEQLRHDEGPSLDSYRSGVALHCGISPEHRRWPRFVPRAQQVGFASVSVLPMRLRSDVIGVLNLYSESPDPLESDDRMAAQALADIATIGILQARALRDERTVNFQLENALTSRILIEQAKGVVAERFSITVDVAFQLIRD
jgi:GAF domain-containing protein